MDKYQGLSISVCGLDQGGQQTIPGDYSLIHEEEQFYVMAVSAGSSGSQYFRSYQGARYAVEAAVSSLKVFASSVTGEALFADERTRERMIRQLEGSIIVGWGEKVRRHLAGNPFLPEEIDGVEDEKYKNGYRKGTDLEYAYRANIMAAVVTKEYCLVIRNGNGQCTVMKAGRQMEEPIPWNKKCTDSYSTSLCERSVLQDFRHYCAREVPPAVFLVTDGMCRCFEEPEEYHGYMEQLMQRALRNSSDAKEYLRVNLPELSRRGSHGDMCLAGMWCSADFQEILAADGKREQEERLRQEELEKAVSDPISLESVSGQDVKWRKVFPVLFGIAVTVAVFFWVRSGGPDKDKKEMTVATTEAEQSLEDKLETGSGDNEKKSESIGQSLEESSVMASQEETPIEISIPPLTESGG